MIEDSGESVKLRDRCKRGLHFALHELHDKMAAPAVVFEKIVNLRDSNDTMVQNLVGLILTKCFILGHSITEFDHDVIG